MGKAGKDYKESTQRIIDCVNCPYQVFGGENMAEDAKRSYHDAMKRGRKEKFMPLLVISDDILAETLEALKEDSYSKEKVIRQQETDIEQELKERYEEIAERCQEMDEEEMREEWYWQTGEDFDDAFEEFGETVSEFSSFYLSSDEGEEETILFEIPVENPWEVIAWVPMGGWNECAGIGIRSMAPSRLSCLPIPWNLYSRSRWQMESWQCRRRESILRSALTVWIREPRRDLWRSLPAASASQPIGFSGGIDIHGEYKMAEIKYWLNYEGFCATILKADAACPETVYSGWAFRFGARPPARRSVA